jgi:hypothetical protein
LRQAALHPDISEPGSDIDIHRGLFLLFSILNDFQIRPIFSTDYGDAETDLLR